MLAELARGCTASPAALRASGGRVNGARVLPARRDYEGCAAWDLVDMERYRSVWLDAHGYFSLNMAASRGCSFRCAWCAKPIWGNHYLQRSAAEVAAEMAYMKRAFEPDHIWFADDIFGFRVDWVSEFAAAARAPAAARFLSPFRPGPTWSASGWPMRLRTPVAARLGSAPKAAVSACSMP